MSATKHYIDTNCHYNETTGNFEFNDGFPKKAPDEIMRRRLHKAGLLKNESNKQFQYNSNDLSRHQFYQALYSGMTVHIDEQWYNTYLDMVTPSHWLCTVQWYERNGKSREHKIDFVTTIDDDRIAFWFDTNTNQYYCRKLINCKLTF